MQEVQFNYELEYKLLKSKYDNLKVAYSNVLEDKEKWLMECRKYSNESLWDFIKRKIKKGA